MATFTIQHKRVPLREGADGQILVGQTRITLDTVVLAYRQGCTPDEIVRQYPSLQLADVYSVIGYYLEYQADVSAYLLSREEQARGIRDENEARFPREGIRERLMARRVDSDGT